LVAVGKKMIGHVKVVVVVASAHGEVPLRPERKTEPDERCDRTHLLELGDLEGAVSRGTTIGRDAGVDIFVPLVTLV
jgi:hypothetical protein